MTYGCDECWSGELPCLCNGQASGAHVCHREDCCGLHDPAECRDPGFGRCCGACPVGALAGAGEP